MELGDEQRTNENENTPENHRAQDSPEQDVVVVFFLNRKIFQDQQDNEDVVYGEGILGEVSTEILYRSIQTSFSRVIVQIDKKAKQRADEYPKNGLIKSRFGGDLMGLFVEHAQVQQQENDDDYRKNPKQNGFRLTVTAEQREEKHP
jgi:hypothetical protein